jgi:hypothetical protein
MTDEMRNGAVGVVTRLRLSRQRKCAFVPVKATDFSSKISDWFWETCNLLMNGQRDSACKYSCPGMRLTVRIQIAPPLKNSAAIPAPPYAFRAGRNAVLFYCYRPRKKFVYKSLNFGTKSAGPNFD